MLSQEDLQVIQQMIANATSGPDRTGSGLSRKSLKDAFSRDNSRNPRRLDTHYGMQDPAILVIDDLVALNVYDTTLPPSPLVTGITDFVTCEAGTLECLAIVIGPNTAPIPSLFVETYVNGVSQFSATISLAPGVPVLTALNVPYSAGDLIAVAVTNTGELDVAEVFMDVTLLRKERFSAVS